MYLSIFQKEIVKRISQEKIKTIQDFLEEFNLVLKNVSEKKESHVGGKIIREGESDFHFDDIHYKVIDRDDTYNKLIDFKKVINLLSKAELIEIEDSVDLSLGYLGSEDRPKKIIAIINSHRKTLIIPYNEIRNFEKDFLTPQERIQKGQLWIPIIVAVATVVLSSVLNYFIYTKEREVFIKNTNAFKDSLYIKIINEIDSSIIQKEVELEPIKPEEDKSPEGEDIKKENRTKWT